MAKCMIRFHKAVYIIHFKLIVESWFLHRATHEIILDVGFNFQQLPVPPDTEPELKSIMARCWCKEPKSRCLKIFHVSCPILLFQSSCHI